MSAPSSAGPSAAVVSTVKEKAKLLSIYSMMATTAAGSGHPTSCMSAAELVAGDLGGTAGAVDEAIDVSAHQAGVHALGNVPGERHALIFLADAQDRAHD